MPNFTPYQTEQFSHFAPAALTAERLYAIDPAACVFSCRKSMELAVKWMYACDRQLVKPYRDDLSVLLGTVEFVDLVDDQNLLRRLDFLRRLGNTAAHSAKKNLQGPGPPGSGESVLFPGFHRLLLRPGL